MMENKTQYFVGKVSDFEKRKGWFFGHFAEEPLLNSGLVEIAFQNISNKQASPADKHLHQKSVEINIIISGNVSLEINGKSFSVGSGEFYVVWPEAVVSNVSADQNTRLVVIRAPSINDKVQLD